MKYDMSCKFFCLVFSKMLSSYYKKNYPNINIKKELKDVKKEYKAMIKRTPSLSKDNKMASNLKGAAYFFSMAKAMPDMTVEKMDKIINDSFTSGFMVKAKKKAREKQTLFSEKEQEKMYQDSLRSQTSNDEMDWRFTYNKGKDVIEYSITKCGVCKLALREDCLDYLPSMCKMDFPKYANLGAKLIRTKTLANGDDCCNFHLEKLNKEK